MVQNESKILMCSDSLEALTSGSHENLEITWLKDQKEITTANRFLSTENIYPQGEILRITHAKDSETYVCRARNKGGKDYETFS